MIKMNFFICQGLWLLLASGCGTSVGNPGKKEKDKAAQDTAPMQQPKDSAGDNAPSAGSEVKVEENSVIVSEPASASPTVTFDPSQFSACTTESTIDSGPGSDVTSYQITFAIDSSITATDVKFYYYNTESKYIERTKLYPIEAGTYYVYALSYSLQAGCAMNIVISDADVAQPVQKTIKLKILP